MKKQIRDAFETKLNTWANTQTPKVKIAYQNVPFTPPMSGSKPLPYLRACVIPADTTSPDLNGTMTQYKGLYQVDVVCPAGAGPQAAELLTTAMVTLFPATTRLTTGTGSTAATIMIASPMSEHAALQNTDSFIIPLSCRYIVVK